MGGKERGMEERVRREVKRSQIKQAILISLKLGGMLAVAAVAPNALQMFRPYGRTTKQKRYRARSKFNELVSQGYIQITADRKARLTEKGEKILELLEMQDPSLKKRPKRWDRKWRVLIFDIPERRRTVRNRIRHVLIEMGFVRLQDSVWVYPYDCEAVITLLKTDLKLRNSLLYMIVDGIENDKHLKEHFKLQKSGRN